MLRFRCLKPRGEHCMDIGKCSNYTSASLLHRGKNITGVHMSSGYALVIFLNISENNMRICNLHM